MIDADFNKEAGEPVYWLSIQENGETTTAAPLRRREALKLVKKMKNELGLN